MPKTADAVAPPATATSTATDPGAGSGPGALVARYRPVVAAGYGTIVLVLLLATDRFDRPTLLVCGLGAIVVVSWRNPRPWARFLMDWMPLFVVLVSYDVVRAQADSLIPRAHLDPQLAIDKFIGAGKTPTVRLQNEFFQPNHLRWYDYAAFVVYLSHFVAAVLVGALLYRANRERFRRFAKVFLVFSLAGYATYVVYPAIPPWLASRQGAFPGATRAVHTIFTHMDLEFLEKVFSGNPRYSNPVGALPSEHAAYPLLFLLLFWGLASRRWRIALVLYTLLMAVALVYLGEHYVTDVVMGWIYAVLAYVLVNRVLDRRAARREPAAHALPPLGSSA